MVEQRKVGIPFILSLNGGYVDTAGFLALQGLFTAHVTGNFVTLGAALVFGTSGILAKLLALPVFCGVVIAIRIGSYGLSAVGLPVLRTMLALKLVLLVIAAGLAVRFGPFTNGDSGAAILMGVTLVAAMAVQNAAHRIHLASAPPSTLMTGTTTQIMIDLADMLHGVPSEKRPEIRVRLVRMSMAVGCFAAGCAAAALFYSYTRTWCFLVPPVLALFTFLAAVNTNAEVSAH